MSSKRRTKWEVLTVEEAFGRVLRDFRAELGLSQERFGLEVESGRTYISELERGIRIPTVKWIFKVSRRFGTPPSVLLQRVEKLAPGLLSAVR